MTPLLPAFAGTPAVNNVYQCDLFTLCAAMSPGSVDMILCDLPYGTTACAWDTVIPFAPMWGAFKRVIKPRGAIVLTATEPFESLLICSNLEMFRYKWAWDKGQGGDFLLAKLRPLSVIEDICIFSQGRTANGADEIMNYYPQMEKRKQVIQSGGKISAKFLNTHNMIALKNEYHESYPVNLLHFNKPTGTERIHPTQKPVDLFRYLVRTYTQPGELVFDPCVGSGTTALAARAEGRRYIVGDLSAEYVAIARERLRMPYDPHYVERDNDVTTLPVEKGYDRHLFTESEAV